MSTTKDLIKQLKVSQSRDHGENRTPIATDMYLPNLSGLSKNPQAMNTIGIVPIGCILPWAKNLTGVPQELPANYVECNGQVLSDLESPLHGTTIPSLNSTNRFLRGNTTSGGTGGSESVTLTENQIPLHVHSLTGANLYGDANSTGFFDGETDAFFDGSSDNMFNTRNFPDIATDGTGGGASHENRPPFYNVVWIIRIK